MGAAPGGGRDTSQDEDLMPTVSQGAEKRWHGAEGKETVFKEGVLVNFRGLGGIHTYFKFSFLIPCPLLLLYIHINTMNSNDPK